MSFPISSLIDPVHEPRPEIKERQLNRRILVIEDDRDQADVLAHRFRKLGFVTSMSNDGADGLRKAQTELPDLIIMDAQIPVMDGLEVARRLSDDSKTCCIPVIMLCGMARADIVRESRQAGCNY